MEAVEELAHDIYAAAMDDHPWPDVLRRVAQMLDAGNVFLFTPLLPVSEGGLAAFHGMPEPETRRFLADVVDVDLWFQALTRRHAVLCTGMQWTSDALVPTRELQRSRFFADFLRPCDIGHGMGALVGDGSRPDLPLAPLSVFRPVGSEAFSASSQRQLGVLGRHCSRALGIQQRLRPVLVKAQRADWTGCPSRSSCWRPAGV